MHGDVWKVVWTCTTESTRSIRGSRRVEKVSKEVVEGGYYVIELVLVSVASVIFSMLAMFV